MDAGHAFFDEAASPLWMGGSSVAVLVLVLVINAFRKERRRQLRRTLGWWGLYTAFGLAFWALGESAPEGLHRFLGGGTALFRSYTLVGCAALLVFDVVLPALRVPVVRITSDLLVGGAYAFTGLAVLSAAGLDFGSALAASTVAAAVLTISLQSTLGNVVGGVAIQLEGSIRPGDWVQLENGKQGRVSELRWRHTLLETREWDTIVIPNSALLAGQFTILGRREGKSTSHRQQITFQVDFRHAPGDVCRMVHDALLASPIPNVVADPPLQVLCLDLGRENRDSYAHYGVRFWVADLGQSDPTDSIVRARTFAALHRAGIPLARPSITQFHFEQGENAEREREVRRRARAVATLKAFSLFHSMTAEELDHLAANLVYCPFDAGETITRQGAVAHWLYVLESGSCEVVTEVEGVHRPVATLRAPDLFGEMGLMTGEPRGASVIALTPVVCHRLDKEDFERILSARPALARDLSEILADRRVELAMVREELTAEARSLRMATERQRIFERITSFFGLS